MEPGSTFNVLLFARRLAVLNFFCQGWGRKFIWCFENFWWYPPWCLARLSRLFVVRRSSFLKTNVKHALDLLSPRALGDLLLFACFGSALAIVLRTLLMSTSLYFDGRYTSMFAFEGEKLEKQFEKKIGEKCETNRSIKLKRAFGPLCLMFW